MKALFIACLFLAYIGIMVNAAENIDLVVARFRPASDLASKEALINGYRACMSWGQQPPDTMVDMTFVEYAPGTAVATLIRDTARRNQLIDVVNTNASMIMNCFINNFGTFNTRIESMYVIPAGSDITPAPQAEESFIAKYPYAIAGIAVAILIGIIVAAVYLIQRRANRIAEEEEMLADKSTAPGWEGNRGGANEGPVRIISNGGGAAGGGRGGRAGGGPQSQRNLAAAGGRGGRAGAGAPTNAPPVRRTAKAAADIEGGDDNNNKNAPEVVAAQKLNDQYATLDITNNTNTSSAPVTYEGANAYSNTNSVGGGGGMEGTSAVMMRESPPAEDAGQQQ